MDVPLELVLGVLTPAGLLGLAVWMILTGRLVPGRTHDRVVRETTEERDRWRDIAERALKQNGQLLEGARTADAVVKAIRPKGDDR